MTFKELVAKEHPEAIGAEFEGGVRCCPSTYGYEPKRNDCSDKGWSECKKCWNREIPEEKPNRGHISSGFPIEKLVQIGPNIETTDGETKFTYEHSGEPIASVVKDIFEENGGITVVLDPKSEHAKKLFEEPHILDSGDRTQFESGAVRDMREDKGRFDLVPLEVLCHAITGKSECEETVIGCIRDFQITNSTEHLYEALFAFCTSAYKNDLCTMFLEVAKHFEEGAKKYGESNWRKGIPVHCYIDSAVRHYLKWLRGDKDEPHDRAFVWNLMCCIWEVDYHEEDK